MIEKTYEVYYGLLIEFLEANNAKIAFVDGLMKARRGKPITDYLGNDIYTHDYIIKTYVINFLLVPGGHINSAIAGAFSFSRTSQGTQYWYGLNLLWGRYLENYKFGAVTLSKPAFKSIW